MPCAALQGWRKAGAPMENACSSTKRLAWGVQCCGREKRPGAMSGAALWQSISQICCNGLPGRTGSSPSRALRVGGGRTRSTAVLVRLLHACSLPCSAVGFMLPVERQCMSLKLAASGRGGHRSDRHLASCPAPAQPCTAQYRSPWPSMVSPQWWSRPTVMSVQEMLPGTVLSLGGHSPAAKQATAAAMPGQGTRNVPSWEHTP